MHRPRLSFRQVNRRGAPGHDPGLQKHDLLPVGLLRRPSLKRFFDRLDWQADGLDDFRANGLLLPCRERTVLRLGLPLHRGPHPRYSELVWQRVGQIEREFSQLAERRSHPAREQAVMRLGLLQRALRRRLLSQKRPLALHARDPLGQARDFSEIDRMAETLWAATEA